MSLQRIKIIASITSILFAIILIIASFLHFQSHIAPSKYEQICIIFIFLNFIPLVVSWLSSQLIITTIVLLLTSFNGTIIALHLQTPRPLIFVVLYIAIFVLLFMYDRRRMNMLVLSKLSIEKSRESVIETQEKIETAARALESYFSRYSNYFNLREVANKFSTTLSLKKITRLIVDQTLSIVRKGDSCLLYLVDVDENILSLIASKNLKKTVSVRSKIGTIFDQYILKTRQNVIVNDIQKDFRFDIKPNSLKEETASLIAAPLIHDEKVIGTIRINSTQTNVFSTEDLRILNILASLASSAIGNALLYQQTEELAIRDSLTNLYVHRYFKDRIKEEHRRSLLSNKPLSLLMCDIDYFKRYNDKYGHAAGDMVLVSIAQMFQAELGEDAFIARYGGEEFAILLPNIPKHNALEIAERIREEAEKMAVDLRGILTHVSLSIGVSAIPDDTLVCEELILSADRRLYDAKRKGRNRVC